MPWRGTRFAPDDAVLLVATALAAVAFGQLPFWIARRGSGWRLLHGAEEPGPSPRGPWQFELRHLLLAMFLVAVALSPLRPVLGPRPPSDPYGNLLALVVLASVAMGVAAGLVANLLVAIPCVWAAMVSRRPALALLTCAGLLAVVTLIIAVAPGFPGTKAAGEAFAFLLLLVLSQGATVFGTLRIYRALGFRLVRWRPAPPRSPTVQWTEDLWDGRMAD